MARRDDVLLSHERAQTAARLWRCGVDAETIIDTAEHVFGTKEAEAILTTAQNYL